MVTKSVTFLNEFLSKIGFDENEFFTEEEFDSDKEDKDPKCGYFIESGRIKIIQYKGFEFPYIINATIRPKYDEICNIDISTKPFEMYDNQQQDIIAEYLARVTIVLSSLLSDELYQRIFDGSCLQLMYQDVFAYIKEGIIKNWFDRKGILDHSTDFKFIAKLYDKSYIGLLYFYMLYGYIFEFGIEFHKEDIIDD